MKKYTEFLRCNANKNNLRLQLDVEDYIQRLIIHSDERRIKQVILNLIANALKFTFEGHILLKWSFITYAGGNYAEFIIEDTGIGISEEHQTKLFKLFSMISDSKALNPNGTGIGLTVSKKYVEAIKGEINLKSQIGEGTCVTFTIPINEDYKVIELKKEINGPFR